MGFSRNLHFVLNILSVIRGMSHGKLLSYHVTSVDCSVNLLCLCAEGQLSQSVELRDERLIMTAN